LSETSWQGYAATLAPIPLEWLRTAKQQGNSLSIADTSPEVTFSGYRLIASVLAFSRLIKKRSPEQNIGLLIPTSSAAILTNLAVWLLGKTVVNLNFTASLASLQASIDKAEIQTIYTSRRFIGKLQNKGIDLEPLLAKQHVYFLEDLKEEVSALGKIGFMLTAITLPASLIYRLFGTRVATTEPAAILFSSGSEGTPKGIVLSHKNLVGNTRQVADVLDTENDDVIMNTLPVFHAFGLCVTSLMPVLEGIPTICHPDPTDTLNIAKGIARFNATLFCGTSTFLSMFNRNQRVLPIMLDSIRLVVAGAEKLSGDVRDAFKLKFNKQIYEGYGATETSPVASVNIPDCIDTRDWHFQPGNKPGTVGLPLPGSSFRIVDPESNQPLQVFEDGMILVSGIQVMSGYLGDPEKTAQAIIELDGKRWYVTGDKGHLDQDGYLTIVDRYSRFAKIGGEMVSLGAIEESIRKRLTQDTEILTTSIPHDKKGERIVLLYAGEISEAQLKNCIEQSGLNSLMRPSRLIKVESIPKLGTGKSDLSRARQIAINAQSAGA